MRGHGPIYTFGRFRLDAGERVLFKDGRPVSLTPKALATLLILVENHGHVVEKAELMERVWPDTAVEEGNISQNIYSLRKLLGDGRESAIAIETVPRRGYRLSGDVTALEPSSDQRPSIIHDAGQQSSPIQPRPAALVAVALLVTVTMLSWSQRRTSGAAGSDDRQAGLPIGAVPIVSIPGTKADPALSSDGRQIAFVRDGSQSSTLGSVLYVKTIGTEALQPLLDTSGIVSSPVWSPDGRSVAFVQRSSGDHPIMTIEIISAQGGSPQRLWRSDGSIVGGGLDWSPNGDQLAFCAKTSLGRPFQIGVLSVESRLVTWLTSDATGAGDTYPVFSPDGQALAFVRDTGSESAIHMLSLANRARTRLAIVPSAIRRLAWASDGRSLFFSSIKGPGRDSLWKVSVPDGVLTLVNGAGAGATDPSVARRADRLVFLQRTLDQNLYYAQLSPVPFPALEPLVATTRAETHPDISPDGSRIAFASDRSGFLEVWTMGRDGRNPAQITNLKASAGHPRWSPDGHRLAFDGRLAGANNLDVYVAGTAGQAQRLTYEATAEQWPTWSRDGVWIYFASNRSGSWQIWKVPSAGGPAVQVTFIGGLKAWESTDGRELFFSNDARAIWRMPVSGGDPVRVFDFPEVADWGGEWVPSDRGVYYLNVSRSRRPTFEWFDFDTQRASALFTVPNSYDTGSGFAVSPDGRWLLFAQRDFSGSEIMLLDAVR